MTDAEWIAELQEAAKGTGWLVCIRTTGQDVASCFGGFYHALIGDTRFVRLARDPYPGQEARRIEIRRQLGIWSMKGLPRRSWGT